MADLVINGVTYSTDRLTVFRRQSDGLWQATLYGHYHSTAPEPCRAVQRLNAFLEDIYPDVWRGGAAQICDDWLKRHIGEGG